jgi:hypothetical protein
MQISDPVADAALDNLTHFKAQIQQNRRLLSETRYRIASSRRRLNPAFALKGGADDDERVRATVRSRLSTGALWPVNGRLWAGHGRGMACVVCGSPIGATEVEYETEGPDGRAVAHLVCFTMWHRESQAFSSPATLPVTIDDAQPRIHAVRCGDDHRVCERVRTRAVRLGEPWLIFHVTGSHCVIRLALVPPWKLSVTARRRLERLFADFGVAGHLDDKSRASIGVALAVFIVPANVGPLFFERVDALAHFEKMALP